jgi:PIN domain nuclease of toxin-antitoxin system
MSQMIVLDTHIWLWLINGNWDLFPSHWRDLIASADLVGISPISCYEIALAHQKGRLNISSTPQEWFHQALSPAGIELLPISETISIRAVNLSPVHRDPFDRLIIATALEYEAKLASVDGVFARYPELSTYLLT